VGEEEMIADQSGCEYDVWVCFFGLIFSPFWTFSIFVLLLCAAGLAMFLWCWEKKVYLSGLSFPKGIFALCLGVYSWVMSFGGE
jgi:hypothetical protein